MFRAVKITDGRSCSQQADSIGPTPGAMAHLRQKASCDLTQIPHTVGSRFLEISKMRSGNGDHRDAIHKVCSPSLDTFCHILDMRIVDPRDDDHVYLDTHPQGLEFAHALFLSFKQQRCPFLTAQAYRSPLLHKMVDLGTDDRIHGIHRHCGMPDAKRGEFLSILRQCQTVTGQTKQQVREFPVDQTQCLQRFFRIGQGISRPGDTDDRELRQAGYRDPDLMHRLCGREDRSTYSGAGFIDAGIFPGAIGSGNIAARCNRQMHTSVGPVYDLVETRMGRRRDHAFFLPIWMQSCGHVLRQSPQFVQFVSSGLVRM